jgi:hypothetical protein
MSSSSSSSSSSSLNYYTISINPTSSIGNGIECRVLLNEDGIKQVEGKEAVPIFNNGVVSIGLYKDGQLPNKSDTSLWINKLSNNSIDSISFFNTNEKDLIGRVILPNKSDINLKYRWYVSNAHYQLLGKSDIITIIDSPSQHDNDNDNDNNDSNIVSSPSSSSSNQNHHEVAAPIPVPSSSSSSSSSSFKSDPSQKESIKQFTPPIQYDRSIISIPGPPVSCESFTYALNAEKQAEHFQCSVSLQPLYDPVQCVNGHSNCRSCLEKLNNVCPYCKDERGNHTNVTFGVKAA